jgi:acetylornithine deacetylase/succinyl-diaminopimelate desuccinylase-like protein
MKPHIVAGLALAVMATSAGAQTATLRPDQAEFRSLYQELVETDTTLSSGSCTLASERMAARLRAAGFAEKQLTLFSVPEHPKDGGLIADFSGTSKRLKPLLLLAHIDVVEAKREDWTRDPFKLIEEGGYFYGRGTLDNKAQAAIWTDILIRFAREGFRPKRGITMALTCGEETFGALNGAQWLADNRPEWIDAAFAFNEGGGGRTNGAALAAGGELVSLSMQVGQKAYQDFTLTVTNPGGHSSVPEPDNAIYRLSAALGRVAAYQFPMEFSDVTRTYFSRTGAMRKDPVGQAMLALSADPTNAAAEATVSTDRMLNALVRTTCVATMLSAGHAVNALPQRATANVNCRLFPGRTSEETQAVLERAINDPSVKVDSNIKDLRIAVAPPLDPRIMGPAEALAAKYFPGVPLVPAIGTGATDAAFMRGIPTYGVPGLWGDPDGNGVHGLNERLEVRALYTGRDYLTDLVKAVTR